MHSAQKKHTQKPGFLTMKLKYILLSLSTQISRVFKKVFN